MNDDLRSQLKRIDPMHPGVPTEPVTSESSRTRLEHIMSTPTIITPETGPKRSRTPWYAAVAAVAVIAVAAVAVIALNGEGTDTVASPPLELSAGDTGGEMMSCIAIDATIVSQVELGFLGTATEIDGEVVTLTVDHWYVGGDADTVVVTAPAGFEALIGSVPFAVGEQFIVSATDGVVNYCGLSGPATPELTALYDEAFPG